MKRFTITLFVLFFLLSTSTTLLSQPQTGQFTLGYDDRGVISAISFYVPVDYDSTKSYPFIYGWHGAGDNGQNMRNFLGYILAQRVGAILCCPDANSVNGKTADYFNNLINASLSHTLSNYHIDSSRIIIYGFSWGGRIAYELGLLNPGLFTGIIGLAPAIGQFTQGMWDNIEKIPMATILGDRDFNYDVVNALMNNIKNRGGNLLYLVKPGVQHVDNTYFSSQEFLDDNMECYNHVTGTTGIEDLEYVENSNIMIKPNPASDFVNIEITPNEPEIIDIRLVNPEGIVIYQYNSSSPMDNLHESIILNSHPQGIYFLKIRIGKEVYYRKIIKII